MRLILGAAVAAQLAVVLGCQSATKSLDSDSGNCDATCTSALDLTASDGSTEYTLTVSGEEFTNLQIGCPDGVRAGGPADQGEGVQDKRGDAVDERPPPKFTPAGPA